MSNRADSCRGAFLPNFQRQGIHLSDKTDSVHMSRDTAKGLVGNCKHMSVNGFLLLWYCLMADSNKMEPSRITTRDFHIHYLIITISLNRRCEVCLIYKNTSDFERKLQNGYSTRHINSNTAFFIPALFSSSYKATVW